MLMLLPLSIIFALPPLMPLRHQLFDFSSPFTLRRSPRRLATVYVAAATPPRRHADAAVDGASIRCRAYDYFLPLDAIFAVAATRLS